MYIPTPQKLTDGRYRIQLRLGGKSITVTGETAADCRREATAIKSEHLTGRVVQKKCTLTLTSAIDNYIAARPKLSPSTVRGYKSIQKNIFINAMPKLMDEIEWQSCIDADEHKPKTIRNAWGFIASVYKDNGMPVPNVRLPALESRERPFLQPEQVPTFLKAISGSECELAALLGLHSLRRSEILDVTRSDVDLKAGVIHVRGSAVVNEDNIVVHKTTNKNLSSRRDVPIMIPRLAELVKDFQGKPKDYLITCHPNSIWREVNSICKKNNLPEIGCHGLRHSFVSLAYHLHWSELATMKIAGYSDYNTMRKIYTHLSEIDKKQDILAMKDFFNNVIDETRKQNVSKTNL